MDYFFQIVIAIFILPMLAAGVQLFFGRKLPRYGDWLPTGAMGISLLLSLILLIPRLLQADPDFLKLISFEWLHVQSFVLPMGLWIDNLTLIMLSMICLVSFLVHLFSIGYLRGDANLPRFFAFLAFFSAAMLGLVIADNLLLFFVFWELMGLASYLLISFWHDKPSAADASLKAFLTTKIGDFGLFLGILILYKACGSFHFMDIFNKVAQGGVDHNTLTLAGLFLFLGVVGKSAQFPLHIWLPDAMEAPTPVSALLHAATMVAAGVYLLGRMYPILTPEVLTTLAYVGAITAFMATLMAVVMFDIKKVLAYSTISQLGYMVVGIGTGGVSVGLFHLITHAFFKALLFLGSGSVIHAVHSQDMRDMGGLRKKMPLTFWTFLLGMLALCGLPLFSGFYSKDGIIAAALGFRILHPQHFLPFVLVLGGAAVDVCFRTAARAGRNGRRRHQRELRLYGDLGVHRRDGAHHAFDARGPRVHLAGQSAGGGPGHHEQHHLEGSPRRDGPNRERERAPLPHDERRQHVLPVSGGDQLRPSVSDVESRLRRVQRHDDRHHDRCPGAALHAARHARHGPAARLPRGGAPRGALTCFGENSPGNLLTRKQHNLQNKQ
jgi:NADH-quinone oxidoreductase subunit L